MRDESIVPPPSGGMASSDPKGAVGAVVAGHRPGRSVRHDEGHGGVDHPAEDREPVGHDEDAHSSDADLEDGGAVALEPLPEDLRGGRDVDHDRGAEEQLADDRMRVHEQEAGGREHHDDEEPRERILDELLHGCRCSLVRSMSLQC